MPTPYDHGDVLGWYFDRTPKLRVHPLLEIAVSTVIGDGPFAEQSLAQFLPVFGLNIEMPCQQTSILVVGREEWAGELDELLNLRRGLTLKVYSQEMFFAYLSSGKDPFDNRAILDAFAEDHPALDYLRNSGFDWPSTIVTGGGGDFDTLGPPRGLLSSTGYNVRTDGPSESKRREILSKVYAIEQTSSSFPPAYWQEWGSPYSALRLEKMADSIAAFCRNFKRRRYVSPESISKWEADLNWLHDEYYRGRFAFDWPSTYVR